jgi:transposase
MSLYCGIDLHSNNHVVVLIDEKDRRVIEKRLPNSLDATLDVLAPYRGEVAGVVVESTFNWYWLVDGLMDRGYVVHLANTRMVEKIHELTASATTWQDATVVVGKLNRSLRGWANYFQVGTVRKAYRALDSYTTARLGRWLRNKFKVSRRGDGGYPPSYLYETMGLVRLTRLGHDVAWTKA